MTLLTGFTEFIANGNFYFTNRNIPPLRYVGRTTRLESGGFVKKKKKEFYTLQSYYIILNITLCAIFISDKSSDLVSIIQVSLLVANSKEN